MLSTADQIFCQAINFYQQGLLADAFKAAQEVVKTKPSYGQAWRMLGVISLAWQQNQEAVKYLEKACRLEPKTAAAFSHLGRALASLHRFSEAEKAFRRALFLAPSEADICANLGNTTKDGGGNLAEALVYLQKARQLAPNNPIITYNLANVLADLNQLRAAQEAFLAAIAKGHDLPYAWNNYGSFMINKLGMVDLSIEHFKKALELFPDYVECWQNLLASLLYSSRISNSELFAWHKKFGELAKPIPLSSTVKKGKIRLAYLSADFRSHSVARNMLPILQNHDRNLFEVYLYSTTHIPDAKSQEIARYADCWQNVGHLSDLDLAQRIRADGVDILVFLALHFDRNRIMVAGFRAAPIQISFHDVATSGLKEMDFLIGDRFLNPPNSSELFTEKLLRLPSYYLHPPINNAPLVNALPLLSTSFPTFVCCNNPVKINDFTLELWAKAMNIAPNSRLILKYGEAYAADQTKDRILRGLENNGVSSTRISLISAKDAQKEHLKIYNQADLALDCHPFSGSTTSFEALYMGVPVLTLAGDNMRSRWSASMQKTLGLSDLIASSPEEFVALAKKILGNPQALGQLRANLREKILGSSLVNAKLRTRQLERFFRVIQG